MGDFAISVLPQWKNLFRPKFWSTVTDVNYLHGTHWTPQSSQQCHLSRVSVFSVTWWASRRQGHLEAHQPLAQEAAWWMERGIGFGCRWNHDPNDLPNPVLYHLLCACGKIMDPSVLATLSVGYLPCVVPSDIDSHRTSVKVTPDNVWSPILCQASSQLCGFLKC